MMGKSNSTFKKIFNIVVVLALVITTFTIQNDLTATTDHEDVTEQVEVVENTENIEITEEGDFNDEGEIDEESINEPQEEIEEERSEWELAESLQEQSEINSRVMNRDGKAPLAVFNGVDLAGTQEFTADYTDFQTHTDKLLTVTADFPDNSTPGKKIIVNISKEMNIITADGLVGDGKTFKYDAARLPAHLQGIFTNITYEPTEEFHGIQTLSGKITYELLPTVSSVKLDIMTELAIEYSTSNGDSYFTDLVEVDVDMNGKNLYQRRLEKYTYSSIVTPRLLCGAAAGCNSTVYESQIDNINTIPYRMFVGGDEITTAHYSKGQLAKTFTSTFKYPKILELDTLLVHQESEKENINYTEDVTQADYNYITITVKDFKARGNSMNLFSMRFKKVGNAPTGTEKVLVEPFGDIEVETYGHEDVESGTSIKIPNRNQNYTINFLQDFENRAAVGDRNDRIAANSDDFGVIVPIGSFHIENTQPDAITDQKIQIKFDSPEIDVTHVSLNSGSVKAYKIEGITTKNRKFVIEDITANRGAKRKVGLENSNLAPQENEYIKEISWIESTVPSGFQSANLTGGSSHFQIQNELLYYGIIDPSIKEGGAKVESNLMTIPASDPKGFLSDKVEHAKSTLSIEKAPASMILRNEAVSVTMDGGDEVLLSGKFNYPGNAERVISRRQKGFVFYFREPSGVKYDMNTFNIVDIKGRKYSVEEKNINISEVVDNKGVTVKKVVIPDLELNMFDGIQAGTWSVEMRTLPISPTFSYYYQDLIMWETMNSAINAASRYVAPDSYGLATFHDVLSGGSNVQTARITNKAQVAFNVATASNLNGGAWVTYDASTPATQRATTLALNPEGTAKYKLSVSNTSGQTVDGYSAIIPIPKAGENSGSSLIQSQPFGWDVILNKPIETSDSNYAYTTRYSTTYETNFNATDAWKTWGQISDKSTIRAVRIDTSNPILDGGEDEIIFEISMNKDTADIQAGNVNIYSAAIERSTGGAVATVPSEPIAIVLKTGVVRGKVFDDINKNGVMDGKEKGLPTIGVAAYEAGHAGDDEFLVDQKVSTKADGSFEFLGLEKTKKVDIVFTNLDTGRRFSNHTISADQKTATVKDIIPSSDAALALNAGLMTPYTVTFDPNTGTVSGSGTVGRYPGEKLGTDIPVATKTGYDFRGWETASGQSVTKDYVINKDETIKATWLINKYKLTYDVQGGNAGSGAHTQTITYGTTGTKVADPNKKGRTFGGWFTEIGGKGEKWVSGTTTIKDADTTLYAYWITDEYKITTDLKGGTVSGAQIPATYTVDTATIQLPDATRTTKTGYTFAGWHDGTKIISSIAKGSTGAIILTATWTPVTYNIEYLVDGGALTGTYPKTYTIEKAETLPPKAQITKKGYEFAGWKAADSAGKPTGAVVTSIPKGTIGNKKYVATWKVIEYPITYNVDGGTFKTTPVAKYTIEQEVTLPVNITKTGFAFKEWQTGGTKITEIAKGTTGAITVDAVWEVNAYTITYENYKDGESTIALPTSYKVDSADIILPKPNQMKRTGYDFKEWQENGVKIEKIAKGSTGNKTIKAIWTPTVYKIAWDGKGATVPSDVKKTYTIEDETYTFPSTDMKRDGYTFKGWVSAQDTATPPKVVTQLPKGSTGDKTYNAQWTPITYTIDYDYVGGEEVTAPTATYTIETATFKLPTLKKAGYTFEGWKAADSNGLPTGAIINEITKGTMGNKKYIAQWKLVDYTITYHLDGGIILIDDRDVVKKFTVESDTFALLDASEVRKDGYIFGGWVEKGTTDGISQITKGTTKNIEVEAVWSTEDYTITYTDATQADSSIPLVRGYSVTTPDIILPTPDQMSRKGYIFIEWQEYGQKVEKIAQGSTSNKIIKAIWQPIEYTITWDGNGLDTLPEGMPETYTIESAAYTFPAANQMDRTGYTFAGWINKDDTSANPTKVTSLPTGSTENRSYKATWTPITYNITYLPEGGQINGVPPITYTIEDTVTLPTKVEKAGYTFTGWKLVDGFGNPVGDAISEITAGTTGNKLFVATWGIKDLKITYNTDGGTFESAPIDAFTVESGTITLPTNIKKEGYKFERWEHKGVPITQIVNGTTDDVTLDAIWSVGGYSIKYINADQSQSTITLVETYTITSDDIILPTRSQMIRKGYQFVEWQDEQGVVIGKIEKGTIGDRTITAIWSANAYTITWDGNGLNDLPTNLPTTYTIESATFSLPTASSMERAGYVFEGWKLKDEQNKPTGDFITSQERGEIGNKDYIAIWSLVEYNINWDGNGFRDFPAGLPKKYNTESAKIVLPTDADLDHPGYTLDKWIDTNNNNEVLTEIPTGSLGHKHLKAIWKANNYTISLDLQGGTTTSTAFPREYTIEDDSIALPLPQTMSKKGYTFLHWEVDGQEMVQIPGDSIGDKIAVAIWERDTYTITYHMNDGATTETLLTSYNVESAKITLPANETMSRLGYTFNGWTENNHPITEIATGSTGNKQITANWTQNIYTITYDLDGGSTTAPLAPTYVVTSPTIVLPVASVMSKAGYTFKGWEEKDGATWKAITSIAQGTVGNKELRAVWEINTYPLSFNVDGKGQNPETQNVTYNEKVGELPKPTVDGFTFGGWFTEKLGLGTEYTSVTLMPASEVKLFAKWTSNNKFVEVYGNNTNILLKDAKDFTGEGLVTAKYFETNNGNTQVEEDIAPENIHIDPVQLAAIKATTVEGRFDLTYTAVHTNAQEVKTIEVVVSKDPLNPTGKTIILTADNFTMALNKVPGSNFIQAANAKAYEIDENLVITRPSIPVTLTSSRPTTVGEHTATFNAEGTEKTVNLIVTNEDAVNNEVVYATGFNVTLEDLPASNFVELAKAKGFNITDPANPIEIPVKLASDKPTTAGEFTARFQTEHGGWAEVPVTVSNEAPVNNEIVTAKNFAVALGDLEDADFIELADAKGYDISNPMTPREIPVKITTKKPTTLGVHTVRFETRNGAFAEVEVLVSNEPAVNEEIVVAHNFTVNLEDAATADFIALAEAKGYNVSDPNTPAEIPVNLVSPRPTTVGTHEVRFETENGGFAEVDVLVSNEQPVNGEVVVAEDFSIALDKVESSNFVTLANAKGYNVSNPKQPVEIPVTLKSEKPTTTGAHTVRFETANGGFAEVTVIVSNEDANNGEVVTAHGFTVPLAEVKTADFIGLAEAKGYDITTKPATEITVVEKTPRPTLPGLHTVRFETAGESYAEVDVLVTNEAPVNDEVVVAYDFTVALAEVPGADFIGLAGAKGYNVSDPTNPTEISVELKTAKPTTVGIHTVRFETEGGGFAEVKVLVSNELPVQNEVVIANSFVITLSELPTANFINLAGAKGYDVSNPLAPVEIPVTMKSTYPETVGVHVVRFETAGGGFAEVEAFVVNDDPVNNEVVMAENFTVSLREVEDANFIALAKARGFDISNPVAPVEIPVELKTAKPTSVGIHTVRFETAGGAFAEVEVLVSNETPVNDEVVTANDFVIKLSEVEDANFIALAGAKGYDVTDPTNPIVIPVELKTAKPTTVGVHIVRFETAGGGFAEVQAFVSKEDPVDNEIVIAENFTIALKAVESADFIELASAKAFDVTNPTAPVAVPVELKTVKPTTVGIHTVRFETEKGAFAEVTVLVSNEDETNNEVVTASNFTIKLTEVADADFTALAGAKGYDITNPAVPVEIPVELKTAKPTAVGVHDMRFETANGGYAIIQVYVTNEDPVNGEIVIAENFVLDIQKVKDADFIALAGAKAYDITDINAPVEVPVELKTAKPTTVGMHPVRFETEKGAFAEVTVLVSNEEVINNEVVSASNFTITLPEVETADFVALAGAKGYDVTNPAKPVEIPVTLVTEKPTIAGIHTVRFETAGGGFAEVSVLVSNEEAVNNEVVAAHGFTIALEKVKDADFIELAEAKGYNITDPEHPVEIPVTEKTARPTKVGKHTVRFETANGGYAEVVVLVTNNDEEIPDKGETKEIVVAHGFTITVDELQAADFVTMAEAKGYEINHLGEIVQEGLDVQLKSKKPTTIGAFEATFATAKSQPVVVSVNVKDEGIIVPGEGSLFANNFEMKLANVSEENFIKAAAPLSYDQFGNDLEIADVFVASVLPTTIGVKEVVLQSKTTGVSLSVTAVIKADISHTIVANDFELNLSDFNNNSDAKLKNMIIEKSGAKVIDNNTGVESSDNIEVLAQSKNDNVRQAGKHQVTLLYTAEEIQPVENEGRRTLFAEKDTIIENNNHNTAKAKAATKPEVFSKTVTMTVNDDKKDPSLPSTGENVNESIILGALLLLLSSLILINKRKK